LRAGHGLVAGWVQEEAISPFPRVRLRLTFAGSHPGFTIAERRQLGWTDLGRIQPVGGTWRRVSTEADPFGQCSVYQEGSGRRFSLRLSRLTPAVLVDTDATQVAFFAGGQRTSDDADKLLTPWGFDEKKLAPSAGTPKYLATVQAGKATVAELGKGLGAPVGTACLAWFGDQSYFWTAQPHDCMFAVPVCAGRASPYAKYLHKGDAPVLLLFQNAPTGTEVSAENGLVFRFDGPAGRIAFLPLLGLRTPDAAETEQWGRRKAFPPEVMSQVDWWLRHLQEYPLRVTESYECDAATGRVTITQAFDYLPVAAAPDQAARIAPLPPYLGIALTSGLPIECSAKPSGPGTPTLFGPYLAVEGAPSHSFTLGNVNRYLMATEHKRASEPRSAYAAALLKREVEKILAAGHLAPWLLPAAKASYDSWTYPECSNPGSTIRALAPCLPLLDDATAARLGEYLRKEYAQYPPLAMAMIPFAEGARREPCLDHPADIPQEVLNHSFYRFHRTVPVENLYAAALYYTLVPGAGLPTEQDRRLARQLLDAANAQQDWAVLKPLGRSMVWPDLLSGAGGVLDTHRYLAAVIGYARLAELAGDTEGRKWALCLLARALIARYAEGKYAQFLAVAEISRPPDAPDWPMRLLRESGRGRFGVLLTHHWAEPMDDVSQVYKLGEQGPYLVDVPYPMQSVVLAVTDLVPETARFLRDTLSPEIRRTVDRVAEAAPDWFVTYAPARLGGEVLTYAPKVAVGVVEARAWVLGEQATDIERYLDVPWVPVGDWFFLHKLAACLTADGRP
jgi:hypothetical protein